MSFILSTQVKSRVTSVYVCENFTKAVTLSSLQEVQNGMFWNYISYATNEKEWTTIWTTIIRTATSVSYLSPLEMGSTTPIPTSTKESSFNNTSTTSVSDTSDGSTKASTFILSTTGVVMVIVILFSVVVFIVKRRKVGSLAIWNINEQNIIGNDRQDQNKYTRVTVRPYLEYCAIMPPPLKNNITSRADQANTSNRTDLMGNQQDRQECVMNGESVPNRSRGIPSDGCGTVESRPKHVKIKPYLEYCAIIPPPPKNANLYSGDVYKETHLEFDDHGL